MNRFERAAQLWALLVLAARHRQVLTYDVVAKATGVPRQGLGPMLDPIYAYCLAHGLPPLTVLVVHDDDGMPGGAFIAAKDFPAAQAAVFKRPWLDNHVPTVQELEAAWNAHPKPVTATQP